MKRNETRIVVSLGSNCGDRRQKVEDAILWLAGSLADFKTSSIYETPPVGHQGSNYMNAVAEGLIDVSVPEFEKSCKRYEEESGRDAEARLDGRVPIDIDIVIADSDILRTEDFRRGFFQIGYLQLR